jgi:hypothetical protein
MISKPRVLPDSEIREVAKLAGEKAHNLFMTGQLLCSEAVVAVVNRALGGGLSDDVAIRMAACLPQGVGDSGCLCGAVNGGALALGLFLGRDRPGARDKRKPWTLRGICMTISKRSLNPPAAEYSARR